MRFIRQRVGLVVCVMLAACGGSGDDPAAPAAAFQGTYFFAALGGSQIDVPARSHMDAGALVADGIGSASATISLNNEDGVIGAGSVIPLTFTVGADGVLDLRDGSGSVMTGGLPTGGDLALGAGLTPAEEPLLMMMVKSVGTFGNASLNGDYHLFGVIPSAAGSQMTTVQGVTFDGLGGMSNSTLPGWSNFSGSVTPLPAFATVGTYAVAADGRVTVDGGVAMGHLTGAVLAGGNFAILAGDTVAGFPPRLFLLLKVGAGLTNATFSGSYWLAGIAFLDATLTDFGCASGDLVADGAGGLPVVDQVLNIEGTIVPNTAADDYAVSPNGTLLTGDVGGSSGGPKQQGAITPDGRIAVMSGSIVAGGAPMLYLVVRK